MPSSRACSINRGSFTHRKPRHRPAHEPAHLPQGPQSAPCLFSWGNFACVSAIRVAGAYWGSETWLFRPVFVRHQDPFRQEQKTTELRDVACKTGRHIQMQSFGSKAAVLAFLEADQDGKTHVGNKRVRGERKGVKNANERRPFADQGPELVADKRSLQAPSCCMVRSCSKSPIVM